MYRKLFLVLFLLGAAVAAVSIKAGVSPLKPGAAITINHQTSRGNAKGRQAVVVANATAQTTYALDPTGTVLTITLKNTSPANSGAVLYAIDPFLPARLVYQTRLAATFSEFPQGSGWVGPVDKNDPTAPIGYCTFAAKEMVLGNMEDYLDARTPLPAGFLLPGQSGKITLQLELTGKAKGAPLQLTPVAYFLALDPAAPQQKRIPVAARGN